MKQKEGIAGLFPHEIVENLNLSPSYRGEQVFRAVHQSGVDVIDEITTLPKAERERIDELFTVFSSSIDEQYVDIDGTRKIKLKLSDGSAVEAVLLEDINFRKTACISTQVGCAMGCIFCKTGTLGLKRNVTTGEIVEQFLHLSRLYGKISNIVVMGMGEPLLNLPAVRNALGVLHHPKGRNIGYRKMTVSTCGIIEGLRDLAENGPPVRVAVSIGSARESVRGYLMPGAGNTSPDELQAELLSFQSTTQKRITIEYVLIKDINDTSEDIEALKQFVRPLNTAVNVIPLNPIPSLPFSPPEGPTIERFIDRLENAGVKTTRRYGRGRGIGGACGLLGGIQ